MSRIRITKEQFYKKIKRVQKSGISEEIIHEKFKIYIKKDHDLIVININNTINDEINIMKLHKLESLLILNAWKFIYKSSYGWVYA